MSRVYLEQVRIRASHLTDRVYIARFPKNNDRIALEKRDCTAELFAALIESMLEIGPSGTPRRKETSRDVKFGDKRFRVLIQFMGEEK